VPVASPNFPAYVSYKALRKDLAEGFDITSEDDLANVSPATRDNPLGYALSLMWSTAGGSIFLYGLGVDDINDAEPYGTFEAYREGLEVLEGKDVYAIAALTFADEVHDLLSTHCTTLSQPSRKHERRGIVCPRLPTRTPSVVKGGASTATLAGENGDQIAFPEGDVNILEVMADLDITGGDLQNAAVFADQGIYVRITSDAKNYLVKSVDGQTVTVHSDGTWWETHEGNDDAFYASTSIEAMQADGEPASIYVRGEAVTAIADIAQAMQDNAARFGSRRLHCVGPEEVTYPVGGLNTAMEGFHLAAQAAAMICVRHPAKPLTLETIPYVRGVSYPKKFSDYLAGVAAYCGYSLALFEGNKAFWRDFETTDNSSTETFEHSMQVPDDVMARIFRALLGPFVGPHGIDEELISQAAIRADAACNFAVAKKYWPYGKLERIVQEGVGAGVSEGSDRRNVVLYIDRELTYPARQFKVYI